MFAFAFVAFLCCCCFRSSCCFGKVAVAFAFVVSAAVAFAFDGVAFASQAGGSSRSGPDSTHWREWHLEIWLGSPAASYSIQSSAPLPPHIGGSSTWRSGQAPPQLAMPSNQTHHSLHTLEGVALGDLVRLPRSQPFNLMKRTTPSHISESGT